MLLPFLYDYFIEKYSFFFTSKKILLLSRYLLLRGNTSFLKRCLQLIKCFLRSKTGHEKTVHIKNRKTCKG